MFLEAWPELFHKVKESMLTILYGISSFLIKNFKYLEPGSQFRNSQYWILSFWVIYVPPCFDSCLNCKSQRSVNLLFYLQHSIPIRSPFLNLEEKVDSCHSYLAFRTSHAIFGFTLSLWSVCGGRALVHVFCSVIICYWWLALVVCFPGACW